jgi:2'-5' RNA ligase
MNNHKYSLWLVPEGDALTTLNTLVTTFASEAGSATFIPHMTLIGDLIASEEEAIRVSKAIASQSRPVAIKLVAAETMDEFYRCVFVTAEVTDELTNLYAKTHEVFPAASGEHFVKKPHLSVLYGQYDDETKQGYADRAQAVLPVGWTASKATLLYTEGEPESWRTVAEFPLGEV